MILQAKAGILLHLNENDVRKQTEKKIGVKICSILYPQYNFGGHIVRKS